LGSRRRAAKFFHVAASGPERGEAVAASLAEGPGLTASRGSGNLAEALLRVLLPEGVDCSLGVLFENSTVCHSYDDELVCMP
jgi:hypothetical protein